MPLIIAPLDVELKIVKVQVDDKTKKHLESLGLYVGGIVKVISDNRGNLICLVKGVRIGLDRDLASRIIVA